MNILILGAGNMGSALASRFANAGHRVRIAARTPGKAESVAAATGAQAYAAGQLLADDEVVVLATGHADAVPALQALGPLDGKVVIDITNPLAADYMGLTLGHDTSAAEEIAKAFPTIELVKAFNTLFAQVLAQGPAFAGGQIATAFYAGDSERARQTARSLIESIGFAAQDAGPLKNARYLEPLAGLNIWFGYGAGLGTDIAPAWIARE